MKSDRRSIAEKFLELCAYYQISVSAVNREYAEVFLRKSAHFLYPDVEILARFLNSEQILFACGYCFFHYDSSNLNVVAVHYPMDINAVSGSQK